MGDHVQRGTEVAMLAVVGVMIVVVLTIGVVVDRRDRRYAAAHDDIGSDIHQHLQLWVQQGIRLRRTDNDGSDRVRPPGR